MREERFEIPVFEDQLQVGRHIGEVGNTDGDTVVFIGGIHGNETAGIGALNRVFDHLKLNKPELKGRAVALVGNLEATRLGQRYVYKDMNRIWTREILDDLHYGRLDTRHTEYAELVQMYGELQKIIETTKGRLYIIDLHTTSSPTIPFIVTNKTENCIAFTREFPMPVVSGLSGFLDGTLLAYMNDLGHTALAYEGGQHKSFQSMIRHESFVWLCLYKTGLLPDMDQHLVDFHQNILEEELVTRNNHFKLISRYRIKEGEDFKMNPGYTNFQKVHEGEELAVNQHGSICSPYNGYIFMPLYQPMGDDGFFIIKPESE